MRDTAGDTNTNSRTTLAGSGPFDGRSSLGPRTAACLSSCAGTILCYTLGADWLAAPLLGFPAGAWLVGGAVGVTHFVAARRGELFRTLPTRTTNEPTAKPDAGAEGPTLFDQHDDECAADDRPPPSRRGRRGEIVVAVRLDEPERSAFLSMAARHLPLGAAMRWEAVDEAATVDADAIITGQPDGSVEVTLCGAHESVSGWRDWGRDGAASYAALFPTRFDPCCITLERCDLTEKRQARLLARLVEAAVASVRFFNSDHFDGVEYTPGEGNPAGAVEGAMIAMADLVHDDWENGAACTAPVCRAAASVVGAFLASWTGTIEEEERLRAAEAAFAAMGDDPCSLLRVCAVRIAAYRDEEALRGLGSSAHRLLRDRAVCDSDPLPEVFGEIERAQREGGECAGALSLGRLAAGVTLVWSTAPDGSLAYLREDLLEDLRFAGWLCGRDQDHRLLKEVLSGAEHVRLAERGPALRAAA